MMLAIYAIKCGNYHPKKNPNPVTQEEFEEDAWSLLDDFNERGKRADNPFTDYDVLCALQVYEDRGLITYPRNSVAYKYGIEIVPSVPRREKGKRMKQKAHLKTARTALEIRNDEAGRTLQGRPKGSGTKQEQVAAYRAEHPDASVTEVAKALGISRPTVYKWWESQSPPEPETPVFYRYTPTGVEPIRFDDTQPVTRQRQREPASLRALRSYMEKGKERDPE